MQKRTIILLVENDGSWQLQWKKVAVFSRRKKKRQLQFLALNGRQILARGNALRLITYFPIATHSEVIQSDAIAWGEIYDAGENSSIRQEEYKY